MAAGDTLAGRRVHDVPTHKMERGDYGTVNTPDGPSWSACTPSGDHGNLDGHEITEHEDGTITVSPSILVTAGREECWHGYLERGVWREV